MSLESSEGYSSFTLPKSNTPYQTYYRKFTAESQNKPGDALPLVIAHGGPLLGHNYCLSLQELAHDPRLSFVLFYDQVGCGKSTHLVEEDKEPFAKEFWDNNLLQLKSLAQDLKLSTTGFYLFGHSGGSMLATIYAATYPQEVKGLILANATTSLPAVRRANLEVLKTFPSEVADTIIEFEEFSLGIRSETAITMEQYMGACETFRAKHFNRVTPPSEYCQQSMAVIFGVIDVFNLVCGGFTQFLWGGPAAEFSTESMLSQITMPTLVIKAEYDQLLDSCQEPLMQHITNVQSVTLTDASHMIMDEVPEKVVKTVSDFIAQL